MKDENAKSNRTAADIPEETVYIDRSGGNFNVKLPNGERVNESDLDDAYGAAQTWAMKHKRPVKIVDMHSGVRKVVDRHGNIEDLDEPTDKAGSSPLKMRRDYGTRSASELLDMVADRLEACGMREAAEKIDVISNTLDALKPSIAPVSHKTAAAKYIDPSADEMRAFLKKTFPDGDDFDVEAAIWWFGNDYHGGQSSSLYSALSTSKFKPGPTHHSVKDEGEMAKMMYEALEKEFDI